MSKKKKKKGKKGKKTSKKTKKKKKKKKNSGISGLVTDVQDRALAGVLFGPPFIGKTSFGAAIEDCVFMVDKGEEGGINDLKLANLVDRKIPVRTVEDFTDMLSFLQELMNPDKHNFKHLVGDSLTGFERLCFDYCCEEEFEGDWSNQGFHSFQQGYDISKRKYWPMLLDALDEVREAGVNILLLGHSEIKRYDDPESDGYDRFIPSIHPKIWGITHRWADYVLFANFDVTVEKKKGGAKSRAEGGDTRTMYTQYSPAYDAKNRFDLPPTIDMGDSGEEAWSNFQEELENALAD